jgi:hypothetical protein
MAVLLLVESRQLAPLTFDCWRLISTAMMAPPFASFFVTKSLVTDDFRRCLPLLAFVLVFIARLLV